VRRLLCALFGHVIVTGLHPNDRSEVCIRCRAVWDSCTAGSIRRLPMSPEEFRSAVAARPTDKTRYARIAWRTAQ
jgi:hypothetical protein